ncbi:hypothetical protein DAMA08_001690 [Martiniozyma asiatica (nom. inval.)]|nr:hypothetical protein DAMA08_001690 [Martiniozyma asiatica]
MTINKFEAHILSKYSQIADAYGTKLLEYIKNDYGKLENIQIYELFKQIMTMVLFSNSLTNPAFYDLVHTLCYVD